MVDELIRNPERINNTNQYYFLKEIIFKRLLQI